MTSHKQHETSMENTMSHHSPLPIFMHLTHLLLYFIYLQQTVKCFMNFTNYSLLQLCFIFGLQFGFWIWIWNFKGFSPSYSYIVLLYISLLNRILIYSKFNCIIYTVDQLNLYEQTNHCFYVNNHLSRNFCVSILRSNRVYLIYAVFKLN